MKINGNKMTMILRQTIPYIFMSTTASCSSDMYLLDISVEKLYTELNIVWVGILAEDLPYENY